MRPFSYMKASNQAQVVKDIQTNHSSVIAGGTNLIDLMKLDVLSPSTLIDVNSLAALSTITDDKTQINIGALVRNSDLAHNTLVTANFPALSEAILAGASAQIRNVATTAGNILQKTRCYYYRNADMPCNKRAPGSGCPAISGQNRIHAILGGSSSCIATNPSDMAVALCMADATVHVESSKGKRQIPISKFYLLPQDHPEKEFQLQSDELVTHVAIPKAPALKKSIYLKIRDRDSFAFALVSVACSLELRNSVIKSARLALGGVGTVPWRCLDAEKYLKGKPASNESFKQAAEIALHGAVPQKYNRFKIELAKRTIVRAFSKLVKANDH